MKQATNSTALVLPADSGETNTLPELRDIKPPVEIPHDWAWLMWVGVGIVAGFCLFFLWRYYRQRKGISSAQPIIIPPHVRARQRLKEAEMDLNEAKVFCTKVSDAVRVYLEERFELHAPDRTTEEFLHELQSSLVLNIEHKQSLADFLETSDLVKFAKFEPNQEQLRSMLNMAHRLVDETEPHAPTPTAGNREAATPREDNQLS